ncbi:MAG: protein kinase [Verrucomicrobiaceae bacterium]|nr:protein kinase [Verrucomicrobiaceae bacterium]
MCTELVSFTRADMTEEQIDELSIACANGDLPRVQTLLKGGINEATDAKGWHPIHWAAQEGHAQIVELLLCNGAAADIRTVQEGLTPLMLCICSGNEDVARCLLNAGADPNLTFSFLGGSSPLHTAAAYNKSGMAQLLLNFGALTSVRDESGESPVDLAKINNAGEVMNLFSGSAEV